jgi:uncharacterized protein (DUF302 family)
MSDAFTLATSVDEPFEVTLAAVRAALVDNGFGIITEIDLAGTLQQKLGVTIPAQVILGACRPELAHLAVQADPSIAAMLPCNVVVRAVDDRSTLVEAFDPGVMTTLVDKPALEPVAADARERLQAALDQVVS